MPNNEKIIRLRLAISTEFVTVRKPIEQSLERQKRITAYYNELRKIMGAKKALYLLIELAQNMQIFLDIEDEFWCGRIGQDRPNR